MENIDWIKFNRKKNEELNLAFKRGETNFICCHDWVPSEAHDYDSDNLCIKCHARKNKPQYN